jgi:hypothetical protein
MRMSRIRQKPSQTSFSDFENLGSWILKSRVKSAPFRSLLDFKSQILKIALDPNGPDWAHNTVALLATSLKSSPEYVSPASDGRQGTD